MYAKFDAVVMRYSRSHVRKVSAASKFKKTNSSQLSKRAMDKGYNGHFTTHCASLEKVRENKFNKFTLPPRINIDIVDPTTSSSLNE